MSTKDRKKKRGGGLAIVICIVVIIALVGVIIYLMQDKKTTGNESSTERKVLEESRSVAITEDNVGNLEEILPKPSGKKISFTESMSHTWTFADGESATTDGYVTNHTKNQYSFYFDVVRDDTSEVVYSSPIIPVGSTLDNIVLDKKLEKGEYECTMQCHMVEEDNVTEYSTINMILTIKVED